MPFFFRSHSSAFAGGITFYVTYGLPEVVIAGTSKWFDAAAHAETLALASGAYQPIILAEFVDLNRYMSTRDIPVLSPELLLDDLSHNGLSNLTLTLDERTDIVRLGGTTLSLINADTLIQTFETLSLYTLTVRLLVGFLGLPLYDYLPIYTGVIDRYLITRPQCQFSLVDSYIRHSVDLSIPLDSTYFPGASAQVAQQYIPLLLGILLDAPTIQIAGAATAHLAIAMTSSDLVAILSEKAAPFPATGTITIGAETSVTYTGRTLVNVLGRTYLQLTGLTRPSPVTHAIETVVTLTSVKYRYLIGYQLAALHAVRDAGVLVSGDSYTLLTLSANSPVSVLEFTTPRTGAVTVDADGGNIDEINRLANNGFETGDFTSWTVGAGATAVVGTTNPAPAEGTYRASVTGGLASYKDVYQDITTVAGQSYLLQFRYQDTLSTGNAITNGSFETGDTSSWTNSAPTFLQAKQFPGSRTVDGLWCFAAEPTINTPLVNQTLRQDATVISGVSYTLSFYYALWLFNRSSAIPIVSVKFKVGTPTSDTAYIPLSSLPLTALDSMIPAGEAFFGGLSTRFGDYQMRFNTSTFTTTSTTVRVTFVIETLPLISNFYLDAVVLGLATATTDQGAYQVGTTANPSLYVDEALPPIYGWKKIQKVFTAQAATTRLTFRSQYPLLPQPTFFDDASVLPATNAGNNPVDLIHYILTHFAPAAPINETSFDIARQKLLNWQFGADLLNPGDREALAQSMARQCGSLLFRNALGEYTLIVLDADRPVLANFTVGNIVEGSVSITAIPIDAVSTSIYVYFGAKTGGGASPSDFSFVTYATPTSTTHPDGPLLSLQCASALEVTRKEQRLDFLATWIQDLETANLLLSSLVPRHTTLFPVMHFSSVLDALPLQLGEVIHITHPLIPPYRDIRAKAEIISKQFDPRTLSVQLSARLLQQDPVALILDILDTSSSAAFGLLLLRTAYTGPCIRVRRSSDDTELDIGFTSSVLDVAALLAFCGSGDGFIDTWYDQSGNSRDQTQSMLSLQPKIVTAGALTATINGHAALNFQFKNLTGTTATSFCSNTEFTVFSVFNVSTIAGTDSGGSFFQNDIVWGDNGGWIAGAVRKDAIGGQPYWMSGCNDNSAEQTIALDTDYVTVSQHTGGSCYTYVNSQTSGANTSVSDSNMTTSVMRIGQTPFGSIQDGNIAAVLFFDTVVPADTLNAIGSALASYYGITWT